jgi:trans-aconitate 2-methyltransferase
MTEERPARATGFKEWNAAAYDLVSEPQFEWGLRLLDRVSLAGVARALDAGCGSGRLTKALAARLPGGIVIGCDLSDNMARAALTTLGCVPSRPVVCADLSSIPFAGAFDLIFSTATFHWVRDHDRLFAELRGALRDGGRLEAQCGGGPNLAAIHARADALASENPFRLHFAAWEEPWIFASPSETESRLRRAGFASASCWLDHTPTTFADRGRFRAFLEAVVMRPYLSRLPDADLRGCFLDTIVAAALEDAPPLTLDYWRLNISAATM